MEIIKVITGVLEENCYVLKNNDNCLVIDPGDDYEKIKDVIGDSKVLGVLVTHAHFDHIGALRNFLKKRSIKIYKKSNLEEKEYSIDNFKFNVIFTPGHSKDSVTFYFEDDNVMFVGDFIFKDSIGRCDLPGGDVDEMNNSIKKIKEYPKSTILYPGHYEQTTLDYEINNNPYLKI